MKRIAVVGAGSWGMAISNLLANKGYAVTMWARDPDVVEAISETRYHPKYLKDVEVHANVTATGDLERAVAPSEVVVMATPSHAMRSIASQVRGFVSGEKMVVSLAKGVEVETLKRMSEVLQEELAPEVAHRIGILSGPNHAEEVSKNIPSATVISSPSRHVAEELQQIFMTPFFRVYTNPDLLGVEMAAAMKNVVAIAAGISDGLGYGDNTKASLITRGLAEMMRLGIAMGANVQTFAGLAGMGDLVVTCMSKHSRNRAVGEMIGKGMTLEQVRGEMTMVAEGIRTAQAISSLGERSNIPMPITSLVNEILYNDRNPLSCVSELMSRGAVEEMHGVDWEME